MSTPVTTYNQRPPTMAVPSQEISLSRRRNTKLPSFDELLNATKQPQSPLEYSYPAKMSVTTTATDQQLVPTPSDRKNYTFQGTNGYVPPPPPPTQQFPAQMAPCPPPAQFPLPVFAQTPCAVGPSEVIMSMFDNIRFYYECARESHQAMSEWCELWEKLTVNRRLQQSAIQMQPGNHSFLVEDLLEVFRAIPMRMIEKMMENTENMQRFFHELAIEAENETARMQQASSMIGKMEKATAYKTHRHHSSMSSMPTPSQSSSGRARRHSDETPNRSAAPKQAMSKSGQTTPMDCLHCKSTSTPEWRRGPKGNRTLCNACGLFYSKLTKKFGVDGANKVMADRHELEPEDRKVPSKI